MNLDQFYMNIFLLSAPAGYDPDGPCDPEDILFMRQLSNWYYCAALSSDMR